MAILSTLLHAVWDPLRDTANAPRKRLIASTMTFACDVELSLPCAQELFFDDDSSQQRIRPQNGKLVVHIRINVDAAVIGARIQARRPLTRL